MPPKNSGKEKLVEDEDEVLQAVILADSFDKRFKPLTASRPRCLLPICNAPLLDWTLESLALAGVQEVFVICRSFADEVQEAIKKSKWSHPSSGMKIVPIITAKETFSPGDAMRDIYTHGIITSDFVLVFGDLVSNVRIDEVVKVHKERRKTNKDMIMTMVVKEGGVRHRTKSRGDSAVFVLDADTSECLHYEPMAGYPPKHIAHIPREILEEHSNIEIRNDFIDCSIDVCSVEVPSLFQDNFDYGDIRRDFVYGVLSSDLLMKNIYCYVAKEGYAARVKDTKSYDAVSKDILSRWTFPLVPDDNHPGKHLYEHLRGNRYMPKDISVVLSRTCKVGNNTLIGPSTQVFAGAQITASSLGANCSIGANTIIRNSYLFDGVVVGANCIIDCSIIGAGVEIGESSRVARGSLVADGVRLGPAARLAKFERVSRRRHVEEKGGEEADDEDEDEDEEEEEEEEDSDDDSEIEEARENQVTLAAGLRTNSNGFVWPRKSAQGEDEEVDELESFNNQRLVRLGNHSDLDLSDPGSITSSDESDASEDSLHLGHASPSSSSTSLATNLAAAAVSAGAQAAEHEFQSEVRQSLERAFTEGHSVDNAAVELKTLRMASNVPLTKVRGAVIGSVVEKIAIVDGAVEQRGEIKRWMDRWGELINKIGGMDGVETVELLQAHCAASERMPLFGQILAAMYQNDVVDEDDIREWHAKPASKGEGLKEGEVLENFKKLWIVGARMIHQFDEQESDEDEDSEEGSDEEGEEVEGQPASASTTTQHQNEEDDESEGEEESEEEDDDDDEDEDEDEDEDNE
ncbi:nucleotide-diphospho-sugar transferase [Stereum hirsutum FP-91666 SS1]|uniref:nucleotide-diphospho-sugar transferase n=1 Tax=Stereum hirsutum (strain FP-91666) TaxID=721885 RepID=UPI000440C77D|nr:nucleotide-diphospho-sugar transferase [Stereum hirsutum FP-91666 SS1]EIM90142.1 nucleotide-diphospho-sugar transferase [Stereum hirsutum FP-91666 SS1]